MIILASKSPRRKEILKQLGFKFSVMVPDEEEPQIHSMEAVKDLAEFKANNIARRICRKGSSKKNYIIIAADTVVVLDHQILGKPKNHADAINMLLSLSGKLHSVATGVCVISIKNQRIESIVTEMELSKIKFRDLNQEEINRYVNKCKPFDKAGAYGIQERAFTFIEEINGCYSNVVGLPVSLTLQLLHGLALHMPESSC
jgi:septum formation protein